MVYKFHIDPKTGIAKEATEEQIENEGSQILVINGIEALTNPPIWAGDYNGEILFYATQFENISGGSELNIQVGTSIVKEIVNSKYGVYEAKIMDQSGEIVTITDKHYYVLFQDLAN